MTKAEQIGAKAGHHLPTKPSLEEFTANWARGKSQLVTLTLPADLDTPVSLLMRLAPPGTPYSFMLESVTGGENRGRYSVMGLAPDLIWRCRGGRAEINRNAADETGGDFQPQTGAALAALRNLLTESRMELPPGIPPIAAGLYGYIGYDMVRLVEDLPDMPPDRLDLPDAVLMRPSLMAVLDGVRGEVTLCAPVWPREDEDAATAYNSATNRLQAALAALARPIPNARPQGNAPLQELDPVSNFTKDDYKSLVEKARDHVRAGEVLQVVPGQRWQMDFALPPFALYRSLRRTNPSPFMFYLDLDGFHIVGASPEILVRLRGEEVTIRPIAGTRRRGRNEAEDRALEAELLSDPKERAEHEMLIGLGRDDIARVADPASIRATEEFVIERYSHVMHIVSNLVGNLREGEDALSALLAGLPAGTVSGAPKLRAMQIIDSLEPEKRGVYGGGVGYFSANGDMDMCIALRTAVLKDGQLYVQAGGGIVQDSDPDLEYQETVNKSRALLRAAETAGDFMPDDDQG